MSSQKNKGSHAEKNKMVTGTIMTLAGGILWGVSGVCGQYMFQNKGVTAPWLVSVRLVAAGLLMLCHYFFTDKEQTLKIWKSKRDRRDVIIYGLLGMMPCQYAYFQTIEWSNAGTATVIQYLGPALIVVWVCFRTRRMPTVQEVTGVILAIMGVFLIATHGNPTTLALSGRALLMGLASAVAVALYTLEPARLQKKYDTPLILAWGMTIGGIALTLISHPWTVTGIQADGEICRTWLRDRIWNHGGLFPVYDRRKTHRFCKSQPVRLHGAGILHDPYGTVDESKIYNTGSDRNVICYCNDYYSGNPDKEKTPETLTGGNRQ